MSMLEGMFPKTLPEAMKLFRSYQTGLVDVSGVTVKAEDESLATAVDRMLEEQLKTGAAKLFPKAVIVGEEGGGTVSGQVDILIDPVDGTRELAAGSAVSTIIIAVMQNQVVTECLVAEPSTGRIWHAVSDGGCQLYYYDGLFVTWVRNCSVWQGEMTRRAIVYLDSSQGYSKKERPIFTDQQNARLYGYLNQKIHVRTIGSNGFIQAMMANGGEGVVGAIMLAKGWDADACPVRLIIEAGGTVQAFKVEDGVLKTKDPILVGSYDIMVAGNNIDTVNWLSDQVKEAYYTG